MATKYLSPAKYAEMWRVHVNTVYNWIHKEILPGTLKNKVFIRSRYYIPVDTIPPRPYPGPKPQRRECALNENLQLSNNHYDNIPGQMTIDDLPPWS